MNGDANQVGVGVVGVERHWLGLLAEGVAGPAVFDRREVFDQTEQIVP